MPISNPGAQLEYVELVGNENKAATGAGAFEDWDISGVVPAGTKFVEVHCRGSTTAGINGVRENGSALARVVTQLSNSSWEVQVKVDAARVIEIYQANVSRGRFDIVGYWK